MFVCVKEQTDGFGSQFQNIISAIIFAELNNFQFVHIPFKKLEHNYNKDPLFVQRLEELMNIDKKYSRMNDEIKNKKFFVNKYGHFKIFFDGNIEKFLNSKALYDIKISYMANKKSKEFYFPNLHNMFNVVIHIRNINSHDKQQYYKQQMYNYELKTQIKTSIIVMRNIVKKYEGKKIMFHIMSQGGQCKFKLISKYFKNVKFHLDTPIETTFHQMVIADVLVTSKSSLSYTAALLTNNQVYYKKFWHKGSNKWIHF